MSRYYLQEYHTDKFQPLNSHGTTFILNCIKVGLFGIKRSQENLYFIIPHHENAENYFKHWDKMIEKQKIIVWK